MWRFHAGLLVLLLAAIWAVQPVGWLKPAVVAGDFDTARAQARLATILGNESPHPVDSDAHDAVRARLLNEIRSLGLTPIIRDQFHCNTFRPGAAICARVRNIAFWVGAPGDDAVLLVAHYDSVAAGPGAADDGIGVASVLEIAAVLRDAERRRPLLMLISDGEEAGLIGASAFAADDPLAQRVGAIVNLEARGTIGRANLFQTSTPNASDLAAATANGAVPSGSSLAADVYSIMPNDSDLTMLLPLGADATNYAIVGGVARYHTSVDDLAHLDPQSLAHIGTSALETTRGFLAERAGGPAENHLLFVDLLGRVLLQSTPLIALLMLGAGVIAALSIGLRAGAGQRWRVLLAPPAALLLGLALALATSMALAALRPETAFATAHPEALRIALAGAALLGSALALAFIRPPGGVVLAAGMWAWLGGLALALFAVLPGFSVLASSPLLAVIAAALAMLVPRLCCLVPPLLLAAMLLFAAIALPLASSGEEGLLPEQSAPLAFVLVLLFLFAMPPVEERRWLAPIAAAGLLITGFAAALMVPAHTPDLPRHLTLVHEDDGAGRIRIPDTGALPAPIAALGNFARDDDGFWHTPAPRLRPAGRYALLSDKREDGKRSVELLLQSPAADSQQLIIESGEGIRALRINGQPVQVELPLEYAGCTGRTCRSLRIGLDLDPAAPMPKLEWRQTLYGLSSATTPLARARPANARPVHSGDQMAWIRTITLTPGQ